MKRKVSRRKCEPIEERQTGKICCKVNKMPVAEMASYGERLDQFRTLLTEELGGISHADSGSVWRPSNTGRKQTSVEAEMQPSKPVYNAAGE